MGLIATVSAAGAETHFHRGEAVSSRTKSYEFSVVSRVDPGERRVGCFPDFSTSALVPLCVDLDGTILLTNTLPESFLLLLSQQVGQGLAGLVHFTAPASFTPVVAPPRPVFARAFRGARTQYGRKGPMRAATGQLQKCVQVAQQGSKDSGRTTERYGAAVCLIRRPGVEDIAPIAATLATAFGQKLRVSGTKDYAPIERSRSHGWRVR
jgi:hypothetical protein